LYIYAGKRGISGAKTVENCSLYGSDVLIVARMAGTSVAMIERVY
jgi:hypothetical protein